MGALIARIRVMAAKRSAGWCIDGISDEKTVSIFFADRSAAVVDQYSAEVTENGEEALVFQTDYEALVGPKLDEPDNNAAPSF